MADTAGMAQDPGTAHRALSTDDKPLVQRLLIYQSSDILVIRRVEPVVPRSRDQMSP